MKILVIGGGGQLGRKIIEYGWEAHSLYATYVSRPPPQLAFDHVFQVDKTDRNKIQGLIEKLDPDAVIDTAALHNVDWCETHRDEAYMVNVTGSRNVAEACKAQKAKMVFISTDYVFEGKKPLSEEVDLAKPVNVYGESKLEGEKAVKELCRDAAIVRTSVIYSWYTVKGLQSSSGKSLNYAMWIISKLGNSEVVTIVNDQYSSPTLADSLAETLIKICEEDIRGLYHVAGKTRLNRYDFTVKLAEKMGYDSSLVTPVNSNSFRQLAERPMDSSLNVEKIENAVNARMLSIDEALALFREQAVEGKYI